MSQPRLPLYRTSFPADVKKYDVFLPLPFNGKDRTTKLSKNLYLYEVYEKAFMRSFEKSSFTYIPIDNVLPKAFQLLRDALGKPMHLTSSFRSQEWDLYRGRSGKSKHTYGMAWDLTGVGLVKMVKEAIETKNDLYKSLRAMGINAIGIYENSNFIHIDTRPSLAGGEPTVWYEKKNSLGKFSAYPVLSFIAVLVTIVTPLVMLGNYLYKRFKKKKK